MLTLEVGRTKRMGHERSTFVGHLLPCDVPDNAELDLYLDLGTRPQRAALEEAIRDAIGSRRLRPGERLPSSRQLAAQIGLSRNTVADVYGQLVAEGWLQARAGAGTGAAFTETTVRTPSRPARPQSASRFEYDLSPGGPNLAAFPISSWLAAGQHALRATRTEDLGYPDPRGLLELRQVLAAYLGRVRGVRTDPSGACH